MAMPPPTLRLGLLGCGTVGTGVVRLLRANAAALQQRTGVELRLAAIADRSLAPDGSLRISASLISRDVMAVATRPDVDIVVELLGGREPARSAILAALKAGKDVVTANKALLAEDGDEIFAAAVRARRSVGFEASVAGGIPIIRILRDALAGDRQRAVYGIVNGTCNYILSRMSDEDAEFADVLREAQNQGIAEPDPRLDISGNDAAHKLCLLATLAFGVRVRPAQVYVEGISGIRRQDLGYARQLGFAVKLLAIAKDRDDGIELRVHPTMVPTNHLLADVRGATNAVYVQSAALGDTLYFGQGAGQMPTATAVMADVLEIARRRLARGEAPNPLGFATGALRRKRVKPIDELVCEYYLRFSVPDQPRILAQIANALGRNGISIASVIQHGRNTGQSVPVIMRTHEARERNLIRAIKGISRAKILRAEPVWIRIEQGL